MMAPSATVKPKKARASKIKSKIKSEARVKEELSEAAAIEPISKTTTPAKLPSELASAKGIKASDLLASHVPIAHREDAELCVLDKEKAATHGLAFLRDLAHNLETYVPKYPELNDYKLQAEAILALAEKPRILVGVLGYTGCGKSSLINALLEEEFLLPTNAMRSSTAVAVEVSWNASNNPKEAYRAEIDFITAEEWATELQILKGDIQNRPEGEALGAKSGSEASAAFQKITAVYPSIDVNKLISMASEELQEAQDLSGILGKTRHCHETKARPFLQSVNKFIDSKNSTKADDQAAFWPLVKVVKLYLKAPILENGLALVDLPGLGDSNSGRTNVTDNYIQNLQHIWVCADIVRAIDDSIAKDLLGKGFKSQLLRSGKYNPDFVSFIMTKTDQINTEEVINSLNLGDSALKDLLSEEANLKKAIQKLKSKQKEARKYSESCNQEPEIDGIGCGGGLKRKLSNFLHDDSEISLEQEEKLPRSTAELKKALRKLEASIKTMCIEERNSYTQGRLLEDFEGGLRELEEELREADGGDYLINNHGKGSLRTFCVSSKAYQKLQGRFKREKNIDGFPNTLHTLIPDLQRFACKLTLGDRLVITDRILNELGLLMISLKAWAQETTETTQLSIEQRAQLNNALAQHLAVFKKTCSKATNSAVKIIRDVIKKDINAELKVKQATSKGWEKETIYSEHYSAPQMPAATWKAICRRHGTFERKGGSKPKKFIWNTAFLDLILKPIDRPWAGVFQTRILDLHQDFSTKTVGAFQAFTKAFQASMTEICGNNYIPGRRVASHATLLEDQLTGNISSALTKSRAQSQAIQNAILPMIKGSMEEVYALCVTEKGTGTLVRMQQLLADHVERKGSGMFEQAAAQLGKELDEMIEHVRSRLKTAAKTAQDNYKGGINDMLFNAGPDARKPDKNKSALQKTILQKVQELEATWAHELENPETQLRANNPFAKGNHAINEGSEDEADDSDSAVDSDSDEASSENDDSDSDDDSEGSDADTSDSENKEDDMHKDDEPSLFVST